jgi:hypothetical protein
MNAFGVIKGLLCLSLALGAVGARAAASTDECGRIFGQFLELSFDNASAATGVKRFPVGIPEALRAGQHIRYGFESEYAVDELGGMLGAYMPDAEFGVSKQVWLGMSPVERVEWVRPRLDQLFPVKREAGKLVRIDDSPKFTALPERLILDETGNVEIIVGPVDTLEEWYALVRDVNAAFGEGSMQSTVSVSRDVFFGALGATAERDAVTENLGFLGFFSDYDTLQKLAGGLGKFKQDPTKEVARSFNHPFLGPITRLKAERLRDDMIRNAAGLGFDKESLDFISHSDASYKYTGGTVYRPDIAGRKGSIVLEVRDAHKDAGRLTDKVLRTTYFLQHGRGKFHDAARFADFDSVGDFKQLPSAAQDLLRKIFPNKAKPGIDYDANEILALDAFRNFAWPLRDWSGHTSFLQEASLEGRIPEAQEAYILSLEMLAAELASGRITKAQASAQVQGALARFSVDSGLAPAFERWYQLFAMPGRNTMPARNRRAVNR